MNTTRTSVPLWLPTAVGAAGLGVVIAAGGHSWQLALSALLAALLVAADVSRALRRR